MSAEIVPFDRDYRRRYPSPDETMLVKIREVRRRRPAAIHIVERLVDNLLSELRKPARRR